MTLAALVLLAQLVPRMPVIPVRPTPPHPACSPSLPVGTVCIWQGGIETDLIAVDRGESVRAVVLIDDQTQGKRACIERARLGQPLECPPLPLSLRRFSWVLQLDAAEGEVCESTRRFVGAGVISTDCIKDLTR